MNSDKFVGDTRRSAASGACRLFYARNCVDAADGPGERPSHVRELNRQGEATARDFGEVLPRRAHRMHRGEKSRARGSP